MVDKTQRVLEQDIDLLAAAYRASIHERTGFTPNFIMLGREVNHPINLRFGLVSTSHKGDSEADYVGSLCDKMQQIQEIVRENLSKTIEKQKKDYDSRLAFNTYNVGDVVYMFDSSRKIGFSPKLRSDPWKGPFVVTNKISDIIFKIRGESKNSLKTVHHDRLKPYQSDSLPYWVITVKRELTRSLKQDPVPGPHKQTDRPKRKIAPPKRLHYK